MLSIVNSNNDDTNEYLLSLKRFKRLPLQGIVVIFVITIILSLSLGLLSSKDSNVKEATIKTIKTKAYFYQVLLSLLSLLSLLLSLLS